MKGRRTKTILRRGTKLQSPQTSAPEMREFWPVDSVVVQAIVSMIVTCAQAGIQDLARSHPARQSSSLLDSPFAGMTEGPRVFALVGSLDIMCLSTRRGRSTVGDAEYCRSCLNN